MITNPDNKFQFDRAHKETCQTLVGRFCPVDSKTYHSTMNPSKPGGFQGMNCWIIHSIIRLTNQLYYCSAPSKQVTEKHWKKLAWAVHFKSIMFQVNLIWMLKEEKWKEIKNNIIPG